MTSPTITSSPTSGSSTSGSGTAVSTTTMVVAASHTSPIKAGLYGEHYIQHCILNKREMELIAMRNQIVSLD
jgi:hypothetical protein